TRKLIAENGPLQGQTDHRYIKTCLGIQDLIGKMLRYEYFGETEFLSVKPDPTAPDYVPTRREYLETLAIARNRPQTETTLTAFIKEEPKPVPAATAAAAPRSLDNNPDELYASLGGDAPDCDQCGHTTVRN